MGGVALLALEKGFTVTGADYNIYPPMSIQLDKIINNKNNTIINNYNIDQLDIIKPDEIIIGNALGRGKPVIEGILNQKLNYSSGPEWVARHILQDKTVIAVAGTHGKTTTTSMIAWILEYAGLNPGFLIGGMAENFGVSARVGDKIFVIEADEYDSAFFDKRSKFIHYHPDVLVLNNLEFDHADIFPDLAAIKKQFEYLIRTVPSNGLIIINDQDKNLKEVIERGCWTPVVNFGLKNATRNLPGNLVGKHNQLNALAAIAAVSHVGVSMETAIEALGKFKGVKRRLEIVGEKRGIIIYDDFAHHPTAIQLTLEGLRDHIGKDDNMIAVIECGSNTMKMGVHKDSLPHSIKAANTVIFLKPKQDWGMEDVARACEPNALVFENIEQIIDYLIIHTRAPSHIVLMSNTGFDDLPKKLLRVL